MELKLNSLVNILRAPYRSHTAYGRWKHFTAGW